MNTFENGNQGGLEKKAEPVVFLKFDPYEKMQKFIEAEGENGQVYIISTPGGNHRSILESYNLNNNKNLKCMGGGFLFLLTNDDGNKRLKVFGKSQEFGHPNHDLVVNEISKQLPDFEVFYDPYS